MLFLRTRRSISFNQSAFGSLIGHVNSTEFLSRTSRKRSGILKRVNSNNSPPISPQRFSHAEFCETHFPTGDILQRGNWKMDASFACREPADDRLTIGSKKSLRSHRKWADFARWIFEESFGLSEDYNKSASSFVTHGSRGRCLPLSRRRKPFFPLYDSASWSRTEERGDRAEGRARGSWDITNKRKTAF